MTPAEHNTQDRIPVSASDIGGHHETTTPVLSGQTQSSCTGVEALQAPMRPIPSEGEILRLIASNYLLTTPPSCRADHNDFLTYMREMRVLITGVDTGSLMITVKCDSLEILETLWEDYSSGHLGEVVQRCFVTEELLIELSLAELNLQTTVSEVEYMACKMFFEKDPAGDYLRPASEISSTYSDTQLRKKAVEQADSTGDAGLRLAEVMRDMSKKLKDGSPSVYKLPMDEVMSNPEDMIARQSLGTHRRIGLGETEKVFMVVGATGAGKTTLINSMVNYILGVQWKDEFRFKVITAETKAAQAFSQTPGITAYTFYPMKGSAVSYTFTVIDTPGYGGTGGVKRDKEITEQIKKFFSLPPPDGIDHLDGVGFVAHASQARLTPVQEYIFDSILAIFGNNVSKHIFFMITFADGQRPPVLEAIEEAKIPCPSEKQFEFNNSAFFAEKDAKKSKTCFSELFWKMCLDSFSKFFKEFPKTESVSLTLTREVLEERE